MEDWVRDHFSKGYYSEEHNCALMREVSKCFIEAANNNTAILEERNYAADTAIPENPISFDELLSEMSRGAVANCSQTWSPTFIGHMTSALPTFASPLISLLSMLNQNVVKAETSEDFADLERQVIAMIHHLVYNNNQEYYKEMMSEKTSTLGVACSGGTIANLTALWVARNTLTKSLSSKITDRHCPIDKMVILVSERSHYSIIKAANILGIEEDRVIKIKSDNEYRMCIGHLHESYARVRDKGHCVLALIGVAGTTETGNIDPLRELGDFASRNSIHFHVDAAWGGATLLSDTYSYLLDGVEIADSVTIDPHKQMYVPMGLGMVLFKSPSSCHSILQSANYIIRENSTDLGRASIEGSRPAMSFMLYSALKLLGKSGYGQLVDYGIELARYFAQIIRDHPDFELVSSPVLSILTYRFFPESLSKVNKSQFSSLNSVLDNVNISLQERQRKQKISFISRTTMSVPCYGGQSIVVLRTVLANPLTQKPMLHAILEEQAELGYQILSESQMLATGRTLKPMMAE